LTGFSFTTFVPVRLIAYEPFHDAISETKVGDPATLARVQLEDGERVGVLNQDGRAIGLIPEGDPLTARLLGGERSSATVEKIIPGKGLARYVAVIIHVRTAPRGTGTV